MWHRIHALVIKELLALMRDPRERILIIVPPLIQLLIFSYAATFDLNHVRLAVYDQDGGSAARQLISDFTGSPNFELVRRLHSQHDITGLINDRNTLMVLVVPQDFSRRLRNGLPTQVQVLLDGRNSNTAMIALNYARNIVNNFNDSWQRDHHLAKPPAALVTHAWFNVNLESRLFIVPGVIGVL
ncbi:MAG: ABC transporter permease, partial [Acidihalobacter sp.]